ncbi:MAG: hypothetical protein HDR77_11460 [Bacteroides sp.]|nr:hypothetical protein [Bacteroides sp.]MBD5376071.1 hypothetical protein [Bacteroides sp.]
MNRYLIQYIKENASDPLIQKYVDYFKVELDWFIYNYGDHISPTHKRKPKQSLKTSIYKLFQYYYPSNPIQKENSQQKRILSSLYYGTETLEELGFKTYSSIFQPVGWKDIIKDRTTTNLQKRIKSIIKSGKFTDLFNPSLFQELELNKNRLIEIYRNYDLRGLLLFTDQYFESKYLIDIFRQLDRPSFIFSHGLPGIYSPDVDHRSDYLMVWGEKIKENYIHLTGMDSEKIKVVGNAKYPEIPKNLGLRSSLDDVLVIPISSVLWHQHEWGLPQLVDRSMTILYLYQVQQVLQKLGVKTARFRPHPSIDSEWVFGFLDKKFYKPDPLPLQESFNRSSLVIGATSTTFLESLLNGVNYIIYEPTDANGCDLLRSKKVPPFDGSVPGLEIANTPDELTYLIQSHYQSDPKVLDGYLQPLDLSCLKKLIK